MASYKHVILGGGMVAGYFAKEFFEKGGRSGDLAIISSDGALPYERPPLSKSFLAGKDTEQSVLINSAEFYRNHGIEVRLNTTVTSLDAAARKLRSESGEEFAYESLVMATGARVRTLDLPGVSSDKVFYLRSLGDSKRIRDRAASAKHAAVLGGGFIAMEVAAVLAGRGIETTMVIRDDRMWKSFFTPEMSEFFRKYYTARGVRILTQTGITAVEHDSTVRLTNGEGLDFDIFVAGIGVEPVTDLAAKAGLKTDNGVVVDEFLETNRSEIMAAGDIANYPDTIYDGKRRRVEHWDNAVSQGQHAARALLGQREPFLHVPYFFSDVFDLSYEFWGDPAGAERVEYRGDVRSSSFSAWWLKGDRLVAAFVMGRPDEEREAAPQLIRSKNKAVLPSA